MFIFFIFIWLFKSFSLSQLYYYVGKRRNCSIKSFRQYEKLVLKSDKLKLDIGFLNSCLNLNICPKYLLIKVPNLPALSNFHRSAISRQIKINSINLRKCHHEIQCLSSFFASQLSILEWSVIKSKILKLVYTKRKSLRETHDKKNFSIFGYYNVHLCLNVLKTSVITNYLLKIKKLSSFWLKTSYPSKKSQ